MRQRMMYMPNSLSYYYFDYFSNRVPDYYRASFLSHFGFVTPYPDLPLTIARVYYNSEMFCNNGLMSEAFANMGYLGILVHPILILVILKMLDSKIGNYDKITFLCIGFVLGLRFISSYVITALFTYGLLVVILLIKPKIKKFLAFIKNGKKISEVDFDCFDSRNCR